MSKPNKKNVGAPPKFTSKEEMQEKIDNYFKDCDGEPFIVDGEPLRDKYGNIIMVGSHPPTITGLALALGFHSRQTLLNYQGKKEFMDTVTRAKMRVEQYCEERLFDKDGQRGAEFNLKYNFRWAQEDTGGDDGDGGGVILMPEVKTDGK